MVVLFNSRLQLSGCSLGGLIEGRLVGVRNRMEEMGGFLIDFFAGFGRISRSKIKSHLSVLSIHKTKKPHTQLHQITIPQKTPYSPYIQQNLWPNKTQRNMRSPCVIFPNLDRMLGPHRCLYTACFVAIFR